MSRTRVVILLCAGMLAGAIAGWLRAVPGPQGPGGDETGEWHLPPAAAIERTSADAFEAALRLPWIGDGGGVGDAGDPSQDTTWTLRGLLPSEHTILVQTGSDPTVRRMATSDILPDGSRITLVERNAVVVEHNGCQVRRYLYPDAPGEALQRGEECLELPSQKEHLNP